jgi:hypothetical protein
VEVRADRPKVDLAGVDTGRGCQSKLAGLLANPQRRPDGPLSVIFANARRAKHREHPVAEESVDLTAVLCSRCHHCLQQLIHQQRGILSVERSCATHRAGHVRTEHRDQPVFAGQAGGHLRLRTGEELELNVVGVAERQHLTNRSLCDR